MNFETWEPVYEAILADFGFDRGADERARGLLADLLAGRETCDPRALDASGRTVAIAGAAPSLQSEVDVARSADLVFAVSTAADVLQERGVGVDCMVTDLDKNPGTVETLTAEGVPVAVHAHGDNVSAIRETVPDLAADAVVPTTQAAPKGGVRNFGGFTDGDRAAFLADYLGAARLTFPGWELDDPTVGDVKARKLRWAGRLLYWLERRRGERFGPLEGRRDRLDTTHIPV
jgi:uncharacterized Rossmann fold enzyme